MKKTILILLAALLALCLLAACGGKSDAPAAPAAQAPAAAEAPAAEAPAPEAPAGDVTWEDYLNWLSDTFGANSPDPEAYRALIFQAQSWEDIDTSAGPWDKLFAEDAFDASTWDEFVAAGGVGTYNEDFVDSALTGSGEPTGEASGEPSGEPAA